MSQAAFLAARDFLLERRTDYDSAYRDFRWPHLDRFNWALDHFDAMARGNQRPALWIVEESGAETKLSFAELAQRSNQVANFLRSKGVKRGDRILLMLGNIAPLWECMLAAMKLGAVIIPATTLLTHNDLADRFERGRVRHVITSVENTAKFAALPGDYSRIVVGGTAAGWVSYDVAGPADFTPDGETKATDPLLLYFTSGTTSKPKLVLHSHQSYPVGHLSTMYWLGCGPATSISTSPRRAGPSTPGAASSRRGTPAPRSFCSTSRALPPGRCSMRWCAARSPPSARRPRCGACWCRRISRRGRPASAR